MDALVFVASGTVGRWDIFTRDPKGLLLGTIRREDNQLLFIDVAAEPLTGVNEGPYPGLDAAMAAVAARIGGTCVRWVP
jgi:hypothetical protein